MIFFACLVQSSLQLIAQPRFRSRHPLKTPGVLANRLENTMCSQDTSRLLSRRRNSFSRHPLKTLSQDTPQDTSKNFTRHCQDTWSALKRHAKHPQETWCSVLRDIKVSWEGVLRIKPCVLRAKKKVSWQHVDTSWKGVLRMKPCVLRAKKKGVLTTRWCVLKRFWFFQDTRSRHLLKTHYIPSWEHYRSLERVSWTDVLKVIQVSWTDVLTVIQVSWTDVLTVTLVSWTDVLTVT